MPIPQSDDEWKEKLSPEQYRILRQKGTEPPGSGELLKVNDKGMYVCAGCQAELFSSKHKFHSGSGWPSFFEGNDNIGTREDDSHGMQRVEIFCNKCGGHLGHVFPDGPMPTGKRYCVNSLALDFKKEGGNESTH